jgi:nucleotide-binding universal stress UspA family protein
VIAYPKRILVPLDFSEPSRHALAYAVVLAKPFAAALDLLHVVPNPFIAHPGGGDAPLPRPLLDELQQDARQRLDQALPSDDRDALGTRSVVRVGDPLVEITEYARLEQVDLIVMGTHGRIGIPHLLLGSVAERVVRTAPCPVLIVR